MKSSSFFSKLGSFFSGNGNGVLSKIRPLYVRSGSLFPKDECEEGVIIVDREEFAQEVKEDFAGNTRLLRAIEEGMNRHAKPHERVSLVIDQNGKNLFPKFRQDIQDIRKSSECDFSEKHKTHRRRKCPESEKRVWYQYKKKLVSKEDVTIEVIST